MQTVIKRLGSLTHEGDDAARTRVFVLTAEGLDRDGESVNPAGVDVSEYMQNPVVLWNHDTAKEPIGSMIGSPWLADVGDGTAYPEILGPQRRALLGRVYFSKDEGGEKAWQKVNENPPTLRAGSISFLPKEGQVGKNSNGGNHYDATKLLEYSLCSVGSHPSAVATKQKSLDTKATPPVPSFAELPPAEVTRYAGKWWVRGPSGRDYGPFGSESEASAYARTAKGKAMKTKLWTRAKSAWFLTKPSDAMQKALHAKGIDEIHVGEAEPKALPGEPEWVAEEMEEPEHKAGDTSINPSEGGGPTHAWGPYTSRAQAEQEMTKIRSRLGGSFPLQIIQNGSMFYVDTKSLNKSEPSMLETPEMKAGPYDHPFPPAEEQHPPGYKFLHKGLEHLRTDGPAQEHTAVKSAAEAAHKAYHKAMYKAYPEIVGEEPPEEEEVKEAMTDEDVPEAEQAPVAAAVKALYLNKRHEATRAVHEAAARVQKRLKSYAEPLTADEQKAAGGLQECVSHKIEILRNEGKPADQAAAIAYSMCGEKAVSEKTLTAAQVKRLKRHVLKAMEEAKPEEKAGEGRYSVVVDQAPETLGYKVGQILVKDTEQEANREVARIEIHRGKAHIVAPKKTLASEEPFKPDEKAIKDATDFLDDAVSYAPHHIAAGMRLHSQALKAMLDKTAKAKAADEFNVTPEIEEAAKSFADRMDGFGKKWFYTTGKRL